MINVIAVAKVTTEAEADNSYRSNSSHIFTIHEIPNSIRKKRLQKFLLSVFLQGRSFVLISQMPIEMFIVIEKDTKK